MKSSKLPGTGFIASMYVVFLDLMCILCEVSQSRKQALNFGDVIEVIKNLRHINRYESRILNITLSIRYQKLLSTLPPLDWEKSAWYEIV